MTDMQAWNQSEELPLEGSTIKFTQSLQKITSQCLHPSDFKIHLSYKSPLGSRREFTAPQGNNAIETSQLLGFSFHDHAAAVPCLAPRPTSPLATCQPSPQKTMDIDRSCAYSALPLKTRPRARDAHNNPLFQAGRPPPPIGTPTYFWDSGSEHEIRMRLRARLRFRLWL
jgi:hypothetical protein